MKRSYTILIDTREKTPLKFPSRIAIKALRGHSTESVILHTRRQHLPAGDYALESHEDACLIERKQGLAELQSNCLTYDLRRFTACLRRLQEACKYPVLFIEGNLTKGARGNCPGSPIAARDQIQRLCFYHGINLTTFPYSAPSGRVEASAWVASTLINAAILSTAVPTLSGESHALG